eukprot:GGOE01041649.1.p1 GENE.GGOE01041649.1~~GGOE01041649.1.p1  ORF type:complete len:415 (-),score=76.27 GGOE01041649.1:157-1365(-)
MCTPREKTASTTTTIQLFKPFMSPNVDGPICDVLHSGYIAQGPKVEEFEKMLKQFLGWQHALTLNSGTSGLHLALRLLQKPSGSWPGLQPGDEVLTTALTCTATNWPILANGLRIRWVDVDPATANINLNDLEAKLSPKTKVIMFVHWGGNPVDLDRLQRVKETCRCKFGFTPYVVEDCCHAFGAEYKGRKIGAHGNFAVFSFQAIKHLTTVDGGLLCVPDSEFYRRGKLIRWFGIDREKRSGGGDFRMEPDVPEWGYKFHMNDVNAVVGLENLKHVPEILSKCRENARYYDQALRNIPGVEQTKVHPQANPSYWLYTLKVDRKEEFISFMAAKGVVVSQVHGRNDRHSTVAEFTTSLPLLDQLEESLICIPVGWWLTTADLQKVTTSIHSFAASKGRGSKL